MAVETPILDFVRSYGSSHITRAHMPGHKGRPFLGCEGMDITEVSGGDSLYEASGIIAQSEENAAALFGTAKTLYSTEGSSQCIRAMLYLAVTFRPDGTSPVVVAARNVHKSFVYGAALLDIAPVWLWPEEASGLCSCQVTPGGLERTLSELPQPPAAVYVTSPNYLGEQLDIAALAQVCHAHGTVLLVDNAHGAYLRFLNPSLHPMDLGADLCCDSAHKTLPVLTGGAYLHIAKRAPSVFSDQAKTAMALFGSTSPSYLTLASLDGCNRYLSLDYCQRLDGCISALNRMKERLCKQGWPVLPSDPLRLTVHSAALGRDGRELSQRLRQGGVECEYADRDDLVCMFTPENSPEELLRVEKALGAAPEPAAKGKAQTLPLLRLQSACSPRQALLSRQKTVPVCQSAGCICGAPTVSCPPAIPIAVSGERINEEAIAVLQYYGIETLNVVAQACSQIFAKGEESHGKDR